MTYAFLDIIHPLDFFLTFYLRITDIHHINSTKLSLFAKLHERVASHKVILGERESLLKDIREGGPTTRRYEKHAVELPVSLGAQLSLTYLSQESR